MRKPTDYRRLKNRCPSCGHRLVMIVDGKCTVVNGERKYGDLIDITCKCA